MSKLYLTADSDRLRARHTATGHHWVAATLHSWGGSVKLSLDDEGRIELRAERGSTASPGHLVGSWSLCDLLENKA